VLLGFGFGGTLLALFMRVGGGIYTKAADVGADLVGKVEAGMEEDDPRNPACIADNVGDNVGDIAGMGADLFGSFAESTVAAMIISAHGTKTDSLPSLAHDMSGLFFPVLISSSGILVGIITMLVIFALARRCVRNLSEIERLLKLMLIISTVLQTPVVIGLGVACLPQKFALSGATSSTNWACICCVLMGLWSGLFIGLLTEYYTSHSYSPVREIASSQVRSAATGIIYGLALGYLSCILPVISLVLVIVVSHINAGWYGISLAALGMLSTLTIGLTIDAYGPISDNAGGIAEMARLSSEVREYTDALDAAGNTTAAIGKGFAIGSAALVALALFGAFKERAGIDVVNVAEPWTFGGLFLGALLPYAFSALTMKSVGLAAQEMVDECMEQFPGIINDGAQPNYDRCIAISTHASLREMILPGLLVIFSPLIIGLAFGKNCVAGLLAGALVSGVHLAISMSNSGGAWDNSKKFIKANGLEQTEDDIVMKSPEWVAAHKNSVTGDTVGDPLKDTSGPSLNILVKLSAITSLVFANVIADATFSSPSGGPAWL
jgi:inorganic pyrophosphatase